MKDKKGFTLIELITIIVLLSMVSILALVAVSSIKTKVQQKQYLNLAAKIEAAAKIYSNDKGIKKMFVQTLINEGLLQADDETKNIYDPRDKKNVLNCHLVTITNGEAFLEDEDTGCDAKVLGDSALTIHYCPASEPNCKLLPLPAEDVNKWFNYSIILYPTASIPNLDLTNAAYRWISPLTPDEVFLTKENIYTVNTDRVNDQYQVTVTVDGKDYNAYANIKIDKVNPRVYDLYDKNPENWSAKKNITFKLSDNESGLRKYGFSLSAVNPPTEWIDIPSGTNNGTYDTSYTFTNDGTSAELFVWVEDIAGNTNNGLSVDGRGLRIDNIDGQGADRISVTKNTEEYVKEVILTGKAQDDKSGLVAYAFSTAKVDSSSSLWKSFSKTNSEVTHNYTVTSNNTYYYCVKDYVGNVSCATIDVNNIDRVVDYVQVSNDNYDYVEFTSITGYAQDYKSGIVGYAFTTSSSVPSAWTPVTRTNNYLSFNYNVSRNGNYYFWVKDNANNVSYALIYVDNIARKYTSTFNLYSESTSSPYNNFYVSGIKKVLSAYSSEGYVTSQSVNGNYLYLSATGGYARSGSRQTTCYDSPYSSYAPYTMQCSYYYCPYGGSIYNGQCTGPQGPSYIMTGNPYVNTCTCKSGIGWECSGSTYTPCASGYTRSAGTWFNCSPSGRTGSCSNIGETWSAYTSCQTICTWAGSTYAPQCANSYPQYYCNYGTLDGTMCYSCPNGGYYNRYSGLCEKGCSYSYTYWTYTITVEYLAS